MNSKILASSAIAISKEHAGVLTPIIRRSIALGAVANWIAGQDDSISAERVRATACEAIDEINAHFFARGDA